MKVKLLKKLRKRFVWYWDNVTIGFPWRVYDKELKRELLDVPLAGYYYNERAILMMLRVINMEYLWQSRKDKFEDIRIKKRRQETELRFKQAEQRLNPK